jgi:hypothetical protein
VALIFPPYLIFKIACFLLYLAKIAFLIAITPIASLTLFHLHQQGSNFTPVGEQKERHTLEAQEA